ncbi:hypothetical protein [Craterilacuibacter sp. RT1T]|uniref:hypothetical protein n=1 Tax=Craterilacuibacter sp. RT1T TaxID=2942211 RepID=UPI0020BEEB26|nr:hypothetical protein [Craterilacuibacter sp. RT1T]MCL6264008.1 hypothetical protein [Craterilacuibacter sp. RT1T]
MPNPLNLTLPPTTVSGAEPAQIAAHLAALPLALTQQAAADMAELLAHSNAQAMDSAQRLQLFALFQPHIERMLPMLDSEYHQRELSATPRARDAAQLARRLHSENLIALKHCLQGQVQRKAAPNQRLALLQRVLLACRDMLHTHLTTYHPLPEGFWLDCHGLYRYALQQGWQDDCEVDSHYKALLLLGLSNSNRLSPLQLTRLIHLAGQEADQVVLHTGQAEGQGLCVLPDSDRAPAYCEYPPEGSWQLHTGDLTEAINLHLLELCHNPQQHPDEDTELYLALLHDWQRPGLRREAREPTKGTVQLVSTLTACWHQLNDRCWDFASTGDGSEEVAYRNRLAQRSPPPPPMPMHIINRSPSGLQLQGHSTSHVLRNGELVILREDGNSDTRWQCALVRWVSYGQALETRCGLEIIAHHAEPLMVRAGHAQPGDTTTLALRLDSAQMPGQLLLSGRPYLRLGSMTLTSRHGMEQARMLRISKQTPGYQLIEIRAG